MYIFIVFCHFVVHFDEEMYPFVTFGLHNHLTPGCILFTGCIFVFFHTIHSTTPPQRRYFYDLRSTGNKRFYPRPSLDNPIEL